MGVDLGTYRVKVAGGGRELRCAEADTLGARDVDDAVWLDLVEGAVRLAASRAGITLKGHSAAFLLPPAWTEVRSLAAERLGPEAGPDEVAEFVRQEIGEEIAGCVWDYWLATHGEQRELHVVFTRRSRSHLLAELAFRLGCSCLAIDTVPWVHYRCFRLALPKHRKGGVVLEWGLTQGWLTVLGPGSPLYTRRLPRVEFASVVRQLAQVLGVEEQTILAALTSDDHRSEKRLWQELVEENSDAAVRRFCAEAQRTLEFARTRFGNQSVATVLPVGGVFGIPGIAQQVEQLLGQPLVKPEREGWHQWTGFYTFANATALSCLGDGHAALD